MSQRLEVLYNRKPCYDIVIEQNFNNLSNELSKLECSNKKICVITDSIVSPIYKDELLKVLEPVCKSVYFYCFTAGEKQKNLSTVNNIYSYLIEQHFDRKDILLALGGGVVGDITGFAAATYLRGIDYIQIPTTLLSQVDSSIGGKTGVDYEQYKNR